ncbi:MAG: 4-(cytidine 5'-diphospho)-2-C-methyl-D-erythritol kinase [Bacteroidetes bacterium]|nr:4-(cytidine 5'-diphospho)-2-C-methyl-D-erythritol kinase [Bacteroidota bacterium]
MISFPNSKINLGLNIVEKRPDGFHNIETVFYPVGWKDIIEITPSKATELKITGNPVEGKLNENLCMRAYELLKKDHRIPPVKIHLHKNIPSGAGLGGGSSDAVSVLKMLNEIYDLNLSWGELHHYAKQLGSDCSFFVTNKPVFAQGKGDDLEGIQFSMKARPGEAVGRGKFIVIVHPPAHVSTAEAYAGMTPRKSEISPAKIITEMPIEKWKDVLVNDFEKTIFKKYPEIEKLKMRLYEKGAIYASMSGSGSAVFGISEKEIATEIFSGYNCWSGSCDF